MDISAKSEVDELEANGDVWRPNEEPDIEEDECGRQQSGHEIHS